jgi:superfamily II DNA or RNA helicase
MSAERDEFPTISVNYQATGTSASVNSFGMRPMQERVWQRRGEQYLLIKSPPASGKSRALMFIALDKLYRQGVKQAIIVVPERAIGASFADELLSKEGFFADWVVAPRWNLCDASGTDQGKVAAVRSFLDSDDRVLICTHATFRFAFERFESAAFDDRLIAIDEFHHVSVNEDNILGRFVTELIARGKVHVVAMTGSYFRGDSEAVLSPEDETKFETVTYTYYEQLNGYQYLKRLDLGYFFYWGSYVDDILKVLDSSEKTIVHIPNVNSRESTQDKLREVETILHALGQWDGADPKTGFQRIRMSDGRLLHVADLVDDEPTTRNRVLAALKDPAQKHSRDHVDIIIALGLAKEGFDWIWCEHALTVGYRSSLTEIVQIIGRATRDAPGKVRARFTNLIAEPDASQQTVAEAVNDTLKAIAASLLMEQVLAPRFEFRPKNPANVATDGFDYGDAGYNPTGNNVGFNPGEGKIQIEIAGLSEPRSEQAKRIISEDLNELVAAVVQDKETIEHGVFDSDMRDMGHEITQIQVGKIVRERHPDLDENDQEAVRQRVVAAMVFVQEAKRATPKDSAQGDQTQRLNTAIIDGVRRFAMSVKELDIDLIDSINPFGEAYSILSHAMTPERFAEIQAVIARKRIAITPDEAKMLAVRASMFKKDRDRFPSATSADPWERRMAEGAAAFLRFKADGRYDG